ncbi:MAG: hypothetical protein ACK46X_18285 [Candidatus Sericytochromatia bacterium]
MGGAIKKLAGPIMSIASMFTPLGPIMNMVKMATSVASTFSNIMKAVAPKAMEKLDQKIQKASDWAQNAVGKAGNFLQSLSQSATALGNSLANFPPTNPVAAVQVEAR